MLAVTVVGGVYLTHTVMGRHVFAVGGNPEASRFSGCRIGRIKIGVFVISGLTAGLAAFMGASFYGSASCADATGYELYVIASAVVGGASLSGGKGSAVSAMLGALLIVLIRQSIRTLHFDQNYEWIIIGCAIIVAVVLDQAERPVATAAPAGAADGARLTRVALHAGMQPSRCTDVHDHSLTRDAVALPSALRARCWPSPAADRSPRPPVRRRRSRGLKIAMIAKSSTNPVFLSARTGAEAAAKELTPSTACRSRSSG